MVHHIASFLVVAALGITSVISAPLPEYDNDSFVRDLEGTNGKLSASRRDLLPRGQGASRMAQHLGTEAAISAYEAYGQNKFQEAVKKVMNNSPKPPSGLVEASKKFNKPFNPAFVKAATAFQQGPKKAGGKKREVDELFERDFDALYKREFEDLYGRDFDDLYPRDFDYLYDRDTEVLEGRDISERWLEELD